MGEPKRDYYEVLGVPRTATDPEIKKAYRQKAWEFHPDRNPGDHQAEENFKVASEAFEVLSDGEKRRLYDQFGHEGPRGAGFQGFSGVEDIFSHFGDIFGDLFGMGGVGGMGGSPFRTARGNDLRVGVELTFAEAVAGTTKDVRVRRRVRCETCSGSGAKPGTSEEVCGTCGGRGQVVHAQGFFMIGTTCPACRGRGRVVKQKCPDCRGEGIIGREEHLAVNIPAGVDDGQTLRLTGKGELGQRGSAPGNLYVELTVQPDPRFKRDGADLLTEVEISYPQAALGTVVSVPTTDGETDVEVEAGTQPGAVVVLRGKGVPRVGRHGRGDLLVRFNVGVPKQLNEKQRELLRALAEEMGEAAPAATEERGFFGRRKRKS
ncbi:MAG TPA: molecular chaperone DnaJ [Polyangia bacterium]